MPGGAVEAACSPSGLTAVLTPSSWATAWEVAEVVHQQGRTSARCVVLDLQHLRSVEFDLFDVLLAGDAELRAHGKRLLLVNVLPGAAAALALLDTGRALTVVTLERVLGAAWSEAGARRPMTEA